MRRIRGLPWFLLLGALSCERRGGEPLLSVIRRDSAGVRVVLTPLYTSTPRAEWRLEAAARLDLGGNEASARSLSAVRGMTRLGDGRMVVIDGATCEIRFFSSDGSIDRVIGGCGDAPGRFRSPWLAARVAGDTLVVWDGELSRLTFIDPDGTITAAVTVAADPALTAWGVFSDGHILATFHEDPPLLDPDRVAYTTTRLWDFDARTGTRTPILEKPGTWLQRVNGAVEYVPFTGNPVFASHGDDIIIAAGSSWVVERWSRAGRLLARYIDGRPREPLLPDELGEYRVARVRGVSEPSAATRLLRTLERLQYPEYRLAYDRLLVSANGEIWVRDFEWRDDRDRYWSVIATDGEIIARVRTPPFLEIQEIAGDTVLGSGRDDDGRVHAWVYQLVR